MEWLKKNLVQLVTIGSTTLIAFWQFQERKMEHEARMKAEREVRQWEAYDYSNKYE